MSRAQSFASTVRVQPPWRPSPPVRRNGPVLTGELLEDTRLGRRAFSKKTREALYHGTSLQARVENLNLDGGAGKHSTHYMFVLVDSHS